MTGVAEGEPLIIIHNTLLFSISLQQSEVYISKERIGPEDRELQSDQSNKEY